ncbi:MAG: efflux RND transporter periplasmic adaptor subunit [Planctomycetes bacterium]|nr:efflux RND transporter periplasmic adaptor subunit [Planctomycetota bacterium]
MKTLASLSRLAWPLALALLAAGCGRDGTAGAGAGAGAGPGAAAKRRYRVVVAPVRTQPVTYALEAVGGVEAEEEVQIPARVAGVIESVSFREGDRVKAGDVLAEIDPVRYGLTVDRARAAFGRTEADVREAEGRALAQKDKAAADLKEAEDALGKREKMREKDAGWVTEEELSTYRTRVERARAGVADAVAMSGAQVEKLRAAAAEARALLAIAEQDAREAVIRAPITGVLNARRIMKGQYVTPGSVVASLINPDALRLRFQVNETEIAAIQESPQIEFGVRSLPGRTFKATLYHVSQEAVAATRMVDCLARVEGGTAGLKPGYFARVRVVQETRTAAVTVPEGAILPTDRGFVAWVVEGGSVKSRQLKLGLHTREGEVEVLAGLVAGESLVVRGGSVLREDVAVEALTVEEDARAGAGK